MEIFILYFFISGVIYASYLWDSRDPFWNKFLNILFGFVNGWYVTPVLIGRMIAQIYKFAFMDSLPNEPVSEELEKAATQYGTDEFPSLCNGCKHIPIDAFKVGAKWQKGKEV